MRGADGRVDGDVIKAPRSTSAPCTTGVKPEVRVIVADGLTFVRATQRSSTSCARHERTHGAGQRLLTVLHSCARRSRRAAADVHIGSPVARRSGGRAAQRERVSIVGIHMTSALRRRGRWRVLGQARSQGFTPTRSTPHRGGGAGAALKRRPTRACCVPNLHVATLGTRRAEAAGAWRRLGVVRAAGGGKIACNVRLLL